MREGYKQCKQCGVTRNTALAPKCSICYWDAKTLASHRRQNLKAIKFDKRTYCRYCEKEIHKGTVCFQCKSDQARIRLMERLKKPKK